jgi:hypothetical protein
MEATHQYRIDTPTNEEDEWNVGKLALQSCRGETIGWSFFFGCGAPTTREARCREKVRFH